MYTQQAREFVDMYEGISREEGYVEKLGDIAKELLTINRYNVNGELETLPAVFGYFHGMMAQAKRELDDALRLRDKFEAAEQIRIRAQSPRKQTVTEVDALIKAHEDYATYTKQVIYSEEKYTMMKGIVHGLNHKKDCLIQLSSNNRAEIKLHN